MLRPSVKTSFRSYISIFFRLPCHVRYAPPSFLSSGLNHVTDISGRSPACSAIRRSARSKLLNAAVVKLDLALGQARRLVDGFLKAVERGEGCKLRRALAVRHRRVLPGKMAAAAEQ